MRKQNIWFGEKNQQHRIIKNKDIKLKSDNPKKFELCAKRTALNKICKWKASAKSRKKQQIVSRTSSDLWKLNRGTLEQSETAVVLKQQAITSHAH